MRIIKTIKELQNYREHLKNVQIGFVPTMGALHKGHISLVQQSIENNQKTIVSIFINPTQFDNKNDLKGYPNLLQYDIDKLKLTGVDCVFLPTFDDIYPDNYKFKVIENDLSNLYCGAHREGHFNGVLTIVMKLLNIVNATNAYFGEKDWQQLTLIKQMVRAFFLPVTVNSIATKREKDGLAMSSRNLKLSDKNRKIAPNLYKIIKSDLPLTQMYAQMNKLGFEVDYLKIMDDRLLVAANLGSVRLIDNVELKHLCKNKMEHAA